MYLFLIKSEEKNPQISIHITLYYTCGIIFAVNIISVLQVVNFFLFKIQNKLYIQCLYHKMNLICKLDFMLIENKSIWIFLNLHIYYKPVFSTTVNKLLFACNKISLHGYRENIIVIKKFFKVFRIFGRLRCEHKCIES